MIESFLSRLRKRRRTDSGNATGDVFGQFGHTLGANSNSSGSNISGNPGSNSNSHFGNIETAFWDMLFPGDSAGQQRSAAANANVAQQQQYNNQQQQQANHQALSTQFVRPFDLNERFVSVLDHLDAHVEKFRKDALGLQEKRDYLLMSIDLIKNNDLLQTMRDCEREEVHTYIQRVNSRLGTVELSVRTVRDSSQEDSLSQINSLIDMMITLGDPVLSRQRCQQYLNACCSSAEVGHDHYTEFNVFVQQNVGGGMSSGVGGGSMNMESDPGPVDKKFESVLLGCTLDDQKNIKKRLQALMDYLNKQTISN